MRPLEFLLGSGRSQANTYDRRRKDPHFIAPGERKFDRGLERRGGRKGLGWILESLCEPYAVRVAYINSSLNVSSSTLHPRAQSKLIQLLNCNLLLISLQMGRITYLSRKQISLYVLEFVYSQLIPCWRFVV